MPYSYERNMGEEIEYVFSGECQCEYCRNRMIYRISGYEYPVGAYNYHSHEEQGCHFVWEPSVEIEYYDFDLPVYVENRIADKVDYIEGLIEGMLMDSRAAYTMKSDEFEDVVANIFSKNGFDVQVTQRSHDGGKDIIATYDMGGIPCVLYIEYDVGMVHLLEAYGLPDPYHGQIQYARVFQNRKQFDQFFHGLEDKYAFHKLWLDTKVREHLAFMLIYFGYFNTIPLMVKRIPLPVGQELTDEEMETVCNQILFILGASFDGEMNQLMSELDERIVDSVYKLDLNRPKKSMMRKNMDNMDMKYCMKRLSTRTVLGKSQENIFRLIMDIVYKEKNIDESKMSDQEYDDFIKSAAPKVYDEIKSDIEAFDQKLQQFAKDNGIKKGKLSEGDLPDEGYSITLRELLEGKEPISNTERKKRMGQ